MQGTSANYAPYVDEIRTDALVEFELIDVDAAQNAIVSADIPAASFSSLEQTHNKITQNSMKLATLEPTLWKLDGSYSLPNRVDNLETGYFSSVLSDANGYIDLTVTYNFQNSNSSDGFTVIFDTKSEEVAEEFTVMIYRGRPTTQDRLPHDGAPYDARWVVDGVNVSYAYNPIYYADHNTDLRDAYGYDEEKLFNHYKNQGINEGRTAWGGFEPWFYRAYNTDLQLDSYPGGNLSLKNYILHWVQTGRYELFQYDGRRITGNTKTVCFVDMPAEYYKRVTVHFTKTLKPYRRVRMTEFVFGRIQQFNSKQIKDMRVTYESGLYMEKMPANKLTITIDNSDREYNVLNPTGIYRFLQEGQGLNTAIYINGESVNMGRFYFETAQANDDNLTATIEAYDLFYRLDKSDYKNGTSGYWTLQEAVSAIIADSGVECVINIDASLGSRVVRKCVPQDTSHREALRMVAQAAMVVLYFNRIGEIRAKEYSWTNPVDHLTPRNMRGWGEAKDTGLINNVIVEAKDEYVEDYDQSVTTYIANDRRSGEPLQTLKVQNPLVASQAVADWILQCCKHRNIYNTPAQANPARDIGDCIEISNIYGNTDNTVICKQDTTYDGSVIDMVTAYGGAT